MGLFLLDLGEKGLGTLKEIDSSSLNLCDVRYFQGSCEEISDELVKIGPEFHNFIVNTWKYIQSEQERNGNLLNETHREVFC